MTQNNSIEMKTEVETFLIEETVELIYDNEKLDKWNNLVAELGLTGQTNLSKPEKSPIPFMPLKTSLINVFSELCQRRVDVENYDITPIPVEILDLIALSKRENYFQKIQIWYDDKSPDPVCVGLTHQFQVYNYSGVPVDAQGIYPSKQEGLEAILKINPQYNPESMFGWYTNEKYYLIGKWADVKHSFNELKNMAKDRFIERKGAELRKLIKDSQRSLDDLEIEAINQFN